MKTNARITTPMDKHNISIVIEKTWKKQHEVREGAPCQWSLDQGATHTLWLGEGPQGETRPARLLRTVLYVGVDENEHGKLIWEKWSIRPYVQWGEVTRSDARDFHPILRTEETAV